jgi:hypothetical protein
MMHMLCVCDRQHGPDDYPEAFRHGNVTAADINKPFIFMTFNRGVTAKLFNNPYHMNYLYSIGLRPETAFGCAMNFLFRPKAEVRIVTLAAYDVGPMHV